MDEFFDIWVGHKYSDCRRLRTYFNTTGPTPPECLLAVTLELAKNSTALAPTSILRDESGRNNILSIYFPSYIREPATR